MTFLYPQFLYGLFALAIPVIIHLFNFRRTRKVYFTNTLFLEHVKEASTTRMRLKHYLILLTRLLFIFFLVMAFAQPFLPAEEENIEQSDLYIYLDNSMSMTNEVDIDQTAMEAGINYIYRIAEQFPPETRFRILTNDFAPFSNTYKSKEELLEIATEIQPTGIPRSVEDVYDRIINETDLGSGNFIFWISDFQKSTVGDLEMLKNDSTNILNLVPLNFTSTSNVFIDSVYLEKVFLMENERVSLNVDIKNTGQESREDVILKVFVNNVQTANTTIDLDPLQKETLTFQLGFGMQRINRCRVSIEEFPVTFDNDFYFTINLQDRIKIVELKDEEGSTPVEKVYGNRELFNFIAFQSGNIDYSVLNNADLLVMNGLREVDPALQSSIRGYIDEGGGLMIIPDHDMSLATFNRLVRGRRLEAPDSAYRYDLASIDTRNPFYENVFEQGQENMVMPEASQVLKWGRDRNALILYKNGEPFLSRIEEMGDVYLFGSPLKEDYTSFHLNAIFVPVMYRIAAESASSEERLYFYLSENLIDVSIDSVRREKIFKMVRDDQELVPSQRIRSDEILLELPRNVIEPGFYDLVDDEKVITALSFNIDRKESDLDQFNREEIEEKFQFIENINIFSAESIEGFVKEMEARFVGVALWKYALILSLLFLLAEILIIRLL